MHQLFFLTFNPQIQLAETQSLRTVNIKLLKVFHMRFKGMSSSIDKIFMLFEVNTTKIVLF